MAQPRNLLQQVQQLWQQLRTVNSSLEGTGHLREELDQQFKTILTVLREVFEHKPENIRTEGHELPHKVFILSASEHG